jgi:phosphatidate phosphatase APP1
VPSSSPTLIVAWFCLRRRAAAATLLIVATPLQQRPVEGMPVLMRTGEIGDGARQQYVSNPGAQLGLSAGFVA